MQPCQNILSSGKEWILPVGNIPVGYFTSTYQTQLAHTLFKEFSEFLAIMKVRHGDASLPLPYHFRIGSANLLCHVFLCPVALFTFISQQFIRQSICGHFISSSLFFYTKTVSHVKRC